MKEDDQSIAFSLDNIGVSFGGDSVRHQSVYKLFRLVISD